MRFVKATLAAAVTAGTVTVALGSAPAVAQQEKQAAITVSEEFRTAATAAETAVKAQDWNTARTALATASGIAKTDDERYFVAALGVPVAANLKDNKTLATYLDALIASPRTPPADVPRYTFLRGNIEFEGKNYAAALPLLQKAQQAGFQNENLPVMIASANLQTNNLPAGLAALDQAIKAREAAGQKAPESWYSLAVSRLYAAKDQAGTAEWLQRQIRAYPTAVNWHKAIAVYRQGATGMDKGQTIDLYRLQRASNSMANLSDYIEYGDAATGTGLPWEAKAVIDHGRANGKVPSGNAIANEILTQANNGIRAEGSLDASEKRARAAANGTSAASTGNAYLASGNYPKAIELLNLALEKGSVNADEVNTRLGIAYAMSNQKDQAKAAFAKVTSAPRSQIAGFWQLWLDTGSTGPAPTTTATQS